MENLNMIESVETPDVQNEKIAPPAPKLSMAEKLALLRTEQTTAAVVKRSGVAVEIVELLTAYRNEVKSTEYARTSVIAKALGAQPNTVRQALEALEEDGTLASRSVASNGRGKGGFGYRLRLETEPQTLKGNFRDGQRRQGVAQGQTAQTPAQQTITEAK